MYFAHCYHAQTVFKRVYVFFDLHLIVLFIITAARSGVCRYGRLLYSAPVFFFFFLFNESP